jgi:hypothetical protein
LKNVYDVNATWKYSANKKYSDSITAIGAGQSICEEEV